MVKKTIKFGKIDYYGIGRRINLVEVTLYLEEGKSQWGSIGGPWGPEVLTGSKGIYFSVTARVWNNTMTDIVMGGCVDEIGSVPVNNALFQEIKSLWKKNNMKYTRYISLKDMKRIKEIMAGKY